MTFVNIQISLDALAKVFLSLPEVEADGIRDALSISEWTELRDLIDAQVSATIKDIYTEEKEPEIDPIQQADYEEEERMKTLVSVTGSED